MDKNTKEYDDAIIAFVQRHPAAKNWLKGEFNLSTMVSRVSELYKVKPFRKIEI